MKQGQRFMKNTISLGSAATIIVAATALAQPYTPATGSKISKGGNLDFNGPRVDDEMDPPVLPFTDGMRWTADGGANGDPIILRFSFAPEIISDNIEITNDPDFILTDAAGNPMGQNQLFTVLDAQFGEGAMAGDANFDLGGRLGNPNNINDMGGYRQVFLDAVTSWDRSVQNRDVSGVTLVFEQRGQTDDNFPNDDVDFNFWDQPDPWLTAGPIENAANTDIGDIRIGMASIDGPGGMLFMATGSDAQFPFVANNNAPAGHIILDADEDWTAVNGGTFQFLFNTVTEAIGQCLGLNQTCPINGTKIMEPGHTVVSTNAAGRGPQPEDIRAVQRLYGDAFETNDTILTAGATQASPDGGAMFANRTLFNLSLDSAADVDFYSFNAVDTTFQFQFTLLAQGNNLQEFSTEIPAPGCNPANFMPLDISSQRNLVMEFFDPNDMLVQTINVTAAGGDEMFTVIVQPGQEGIWTVQIRDDQLGLGPDVVQPYILNIVTTRSEVPGITDEFTFFLNDPNRLRINAWAPTGIRDNTETAEDEAIDFAALDPPLSRSRIGVLDFFQPNFEHVTIDDQQPSLVAWNGVNPAQTLLNSGAPAIGGHATGVAAAVAGDFFTMARPGDTDPISFAGIAPESDIAYAAIGDVLFQSVERGLVSVEALYFALFGMTDPAFATQQLGLDAPVSIINSTFGRATSNAFPTGTGDSEFAIAIDALVSMRDITVVLAAGNDGNVDQTTACNFDGNPNDPGGSYVGAKTVTDPATCFNAIVVGAMATQFDAGAAPINDGDDVDMFDDDITQVPSFSSKGPINSRDFIAGTDVVDARPGIHILGPGMGSIGPAGLPMVCPFPGKTRNESLGVPFFDNTLAQAGQDMAFDAQIGTSYAAAAVAGAVGLMQDFGTLQGDAVSHPLIYKACIINSGYKMPGWSNNGDPAMPIDERDGRQEMNQDGSFDLHDRETDQPLDYAQGAGYLDFTLLFEQFAGEDGQAITRDVLQTPLSRSVVTRVEDIPEEEIIPIIGALPSDGFPALAERGDSPFEIANKLTNAGMNSNVSKLANIYADQGDTPFGGGGGTIPTIITRPVTGSFLAGPLPTPGNMTPTLGPPGEIPTQIRRSIPVERVGWDIGRLGTRIVPNMANMPIGYVDYLIPNVAEGEVISASLVWNRTVTIRQPNFNNLADPGIGDIREFELENLDLELYTSDTTGSAVFLVADSTSTFNNVEHIQDMPNVALGGQSFVLRVNWVATEYDLFNNGTRGDIEYALAWRVIEEDQLEADGVIFALNGQQGATGPSPDPTGFRPNRAYELQDLIDLVNGYGSHNYTDSVYKRSLDLNADGQLNFTDLVGLLSNFGN